MTPRHYRASRIAVCLLVFASLLLIAWSKLAAAAPTSVPRAIPLQSAGYNLDPVLAATPGGAVYAAWEYVPFEFVETSIAFVRGRVVGEDIVWEMPVELTGRTGFSDPQIAVDDFGIVHLVAVARDGTILYTSNAAGGAPSQWRMSETVGTMLRPAADDIGAGFTPALATIADGKIAVVWGDLRSDQGIVLLRVRTPTGWQPERRIATSGVLARSFRVVLGLDRLHILYEYQPDRRNSRFSTGYLSGLPDGAFAFVDLPQATGSPIGGTPTIAYDTTTKALAAAWVVPRGDGFALAYSVSTTNGAAWAPAGYLQHSANEWTAEPAFLFHNGALHLRQSIKHWNGRAFTYRTIEAQTYTVAKQRWSERQIIDNTRTANVPMLAAGGGQLITVWRHGLSDTDEVWYQTEVLPGAPLHRLYIPYLGT